MNKTTWSLVLAGVLLNAVAQLLLKSASSTVGQMSLDWQQLTAAAPRLLTHAGLWSGLTCYALSVLVWIVVLSRAEVSVVYPLLSIGYIVNAIAAAMLFGEALTATKVLGIAIIITGVFVLTYSRT